MINAATGHGLARALVWLDDAHAVLTDSEGRFALNDVPVGPVSIELRKPGFRLATAGTQPAELEDAPANTANLSVIVTPAMAPVELALTPDNVISGRIELPGEEVDKGIHVTLWQRQILDGKANWRQMRTATTDAGGRYRFAHLEDGDYRLATAQTGETERLLVSDTTTIARNVFPATWYPAASSRATAQTIHLSGGSEVEANFELRMAALHNVSVQMARLAAGTRVALFDVDGYPLESAVAVNGDTIRLQLADGDYTLQVVPAGIRELPADLPLGQLSFSVAGHDVDVGKLALHPVSPGVVNVTTLNPSHSEHRNGFESLQADGTEDTQALADQLNEGRNRLHLLMPGSYTISGYFSSRCVESLTAGGVDLAHEPLRVPVDGSQPTLELTLRGDCARLKLQLASTLLEPGVEQPVYVYVVPDRASVQMIPPQTLRPSTGGTATVTTLTPGGYHVYAFHRPVELEFRNAQTMTALAGKGQSINLEAGGEATLTVEVQP